MFGVSVELMNLELGCMMGRLEVGSSVLGCSMITASTRENHVVSLVGSI